MNLQFSNSWACNHGPWRRQTLTSYCNFGRIVSCRAGGTQWTGTAYCCTNIEIERPSWSRPVWGRLSFIGVTRRCITDWAGWRNSFLPDIGGPGSVTMWRCIIGHAFLLNQIDLFPAAFRSLNSNVKMIQKTLDLLFSLKTQSHNCCDLMKQFHYTDNKNQRMLHLGLPTDQSSCSLQQVLDNYFRTEVLGKDAFCDLWLWKLQVVLIHTHRHSNEPL